MNKLEQVEAINMCLLVLLPKFTNIHKWSKELGKSFQIFNFCANKLFLS